MVAIIRMKSKPKELKPNIFYPRTQADEVAEFSYDLHNFDVFKVWDKLYHDDTLSEGELPEYALPELRYPDSPANRKAEEASERAWERREASQQG